MSYKIYKINNIVSKQREQGISKIVSLSWDDAVENIYRSFSFACEEELNCGNWIEIYHEGNNELAFYGVITKRDIDKDGNFSYSGYDYGFYLEKNEITIQFRNATISQAIIDTCNKLGFAVGFIPDIPIYISQIFKAKTISEILYELYEFAKSKGLKDEYYFDCYDGQLNLLKKELNDDLQAEIANLYCINSFDTISDLTYSVSIEELKNQVEVRQTVKKSEKVYKPEKDDSSISKYGLLQTVVEINENETRSPIAIAKDKLKKLKEENETLSMTLLGNYKLHKGIINAIDKGNVSGLFECISTKHTINGTKEDVNVSYKKYKEAL